MGAAKSGEEAPATVDAGLEAAKHFSTWNVAGVKEDEFDDRGGEKSAADGATSLPAMRASLAHSAQAGANPRSCSILVLVVAQCSSSLPPWAAVLVPGGAKIRWPRQGSLSRCCSRLTPVLDVN